jgi:hypothetical protein
VRARLAFGVLTLIVTAGTAGLAAPANSGAATAPGAAWSIAPAGSAAGATSSRSDFELAARPGQILTDRFVVANRSPAPITFNLYSADGVNTKVGGAFALKLANEKQLDVGKWITLPTDKLVLPADTEATVAYTVRIPVDAAPGDHSGGIVAQDATPSIVTKGAVRVPVLEGAGVRVYVRVAGPIHPSLAVANPHIVYSYPALAWLSGSGKGKVVFDVANTGNTRLDVKVHVKAVNIFGSTIKQYTTIPVPALLPGSTTLLSEPAIPFPRAGLVRYDISLQSRSASAGLNVQVLLIPWVLVVIVIVVLMVVVLLLWRRHRRKKAPPPAGEKATKPPTPAPEPAAVG